MTVYKLNWRSFMQNLTLEINAQNQPTVIERLLQVTRYRGFSIVDLTVKPGFRNKLLDIKLTVQNSKANEPLHENSFQKLSSQLGKLFDINQVKQFQDVPLSHQTPTTQLSALNR